MKDTPGLFDNVLQLDVEPEEPVEGGDPSMRRIAVNAVVPDHPTCSYSQTALQGRVPRILPRRTTRLDSGGN